MRGVTSALMAFAVVGCATQANFEAMLRSWEGHDVSEMMSRVGPPSETYEMPNGNMVYTFTRSVSGTEPVYVPPTQTTVNRYGSTAYATTTGGYAYGGQTYQVYCVIHVTTDKRQTIISWRYEGNGCRSR
jgi:hypothetical protein